MAYWETKATPNVSVSWTEINYSAFPFPKDMLPDICDWNEGEHMAHNVLHTILDLILDREFAASVKELISTGAQISLV